VFMCFVRISEQAAIMLIQLFVFRKWEELLLLGTSKTCNCSSG
jgi:hypothetical protein